MALSDILEDVMQAIIDFSAKYGVIMKALFWSRVVIVVVLMLVGAYLIYSIVAEQDDFEKEKAQSLYTLLLGTSGLLEWIVPLIGSIGFALVVHSLVGSVIPASPTEKIAEQVMQQALA